MQRLNRASKSLGLSRRIPILRSSILSQRRLRQSQPPPIILPFCNRGRPRPFSNDMGSLFWSVRFPDPLVFDLSATEWTAILLSLRVATVAALVATPFGIAVGWLLARREFWGKSLLDALVHLPLVLPPVVTGYLLLLTFGRRGLVGAWLADHFGIVFAFHWTGAALACGVMGFPLMVRAMRLSFEAIDQRLEKAAGT